MKDYEFHSPRPTPDLNTFKKTLNLKLFCSGSLKPASSTTGDKKDRIPSRFYKMVPTYACNINSTWHKFRQGAVLGISHPPLPTHIAHFHVRKYSKLIL